MGFGFDPTSAPPSAPLSKQSTVTSLPVTKKQGFGADYSDQPSSQYQETVKKFGKAKAISSDEYFGRGMYDESQK